MHLTSEHLRIIDETVNGIDPLYAILRTVRKKVYAGDRGQEMLGLAVAVEHELKAAVQSRFGEFFRQNKVCPTPFVLCR